MQTILNIEFNPKAEFEQCKSIVYQVMTTNINTRNDDNHLIREVWKKNPNTKASTIMRVRREIQNKDGDLLPTLVGVLVKRRVKEELVKRYYNRNSSFLDVYTNYKYEVV